MGWGLINSVAIIGNLIGVLMLFRYGAPFEMYADGGSAFLVVDDSEEDIAERIKRAKIVKRYSWIALMLICVSSALQVYVSIKTL